MGNEITLRDIAAALNVSMTTVHRAIHNKEGISRQVREMVLLKAEEMGYKTNYVASSLKRRTMNIAIVLPAEQGSGQYYHKYFWDAIRSCEAEANNLNVYIHYYAFEETDQAQIEVLNQVFEEHAGDLHGLLTMPVKDNERMRLAIQRFTYNGVPVVLIDNDLPDSGRICCVAPHDTLTGRLGAEILSAMTHSPGKVLVAAGAEGNSSHVHNLRGFQTYLRENAVPLEPVLVNGYGDYDYSYREAVKALRTHADIVAFYSVTARETLPLAQAVVDCGLAGKLRGVGSDLYPQSARLLAEDVVQALVYKNAYDKGERGFRILFSQVVKQIAPPAEKVTVPISIIMKNNLHFFEERL